MLAKINRIKGLGLVFSDFSWKADVHSFRDFNLVYGWNGCGKTTLTRLFDQFSENTLENFSYEVEDSEGKKYTGAIDFTKQVRVFSQDYVQKNVRVLESTANSISLVLGETNQKLVAEIAKGERELNGDPDDPQSIGKVQERENFNRKKIQKEKENNTAFTDIARTIGAALAATGAASRTYRAPDARADFAKLTEATMLSEEQLKQHVLALKQDMLPQIDEIAAPTVGESISRSTLEVVEECASLAKALCAKTVETEVVSRLAEDPDISDWVETGLDLHKRLDAKNCEFCGNVISAERLAQLAKHFNDADGKLKGDVEDVLIELRQVLNSIRAFSVPDSARLYAESRDVYRKAASEIESAQAVLEDQISELGMKLGTKKAKTTVPVLLDTVIDTGAFAESVARANLIVSSHNQKTKEFAEIQEVSAKAIKTHHLSTIFDEVRDRTRRVADLVKKLEESDSGIVTVRKRIAAARQKVSSAHAACDQINDKLRTFLGRNELGFEPLLEMVDDEGGNPVETVTGYKIMRNNAPARYVSEGEKTALAFIYFVVHLNDGQFPKANGIVVIDDPISSLDSNSLYQAFSFLKNAVIDCGQVFVLTHNFDFLKLLLNWRKNAGRKRTGFYMVKNHFRDGTRHATIDPMDQELLEYESEYHYLFKRLKEMRATQDGTIVQAYPVPNIARKVWETFLMFQVPSGASQYKKMEKLKSDGHDSQKLDAIYKFTNDQSHITGAGFDPALVPETQKVVGELLEMMQIIAPQHYSVLDEATPV